MSEKETYKSDTLTITEKDGRLVAEFNNNNIKRKEYIMTRKVFNLVSGIIGGVEAIAVAVVTYVSPEGATAINASICIAGTAIIEICSQFVKE